MQDTCLTIICGSNGRLGMEMWQCKGGHAEAYGGMRKLAETCGGIQVGNSSINSIKFPKLGD